jgi:glycine dehydrogenase subunit 1
MALWVTVYLSLMGPEGMKQVNDLCYQRSHYLYGKLLETGKFQPVFDAPFLKEFVLKPLVSPAELQKKLSDAGFFGALETEDGYVSFCVTEKRSYEEMDALVESIR